MMAKQNATKAPRKHHFYVACFEYGGPSIGVLVFDTKRQAHEYAARYECVEVIGARGAKALMRKQLIKKACETFADAGDRSYMFGRFRRMGAVELVEAYRKCVFC